jgi:hypothetical protein
MPTTESYECDTWLLAKERLETGEFKNKVGLQHINYREMEKIP